MKFARQKLSPSYTRKPNFKSSESGERHFGFDCANCDAPIAVGYNQLINEVFGWEQNVGAELAAEAKEFYSIGVAGKSPDGGWPAMVKAQCQGCGTTHLVYAGVKEVSNSAYSVTVQGVTEIVEEDRSFGS